MAAGSEFRVITLKKWQSHGYDLHSIIATPAELFINPTANNYQLASGSPAIDKGTTLTAVPVDILGVKRPQGAGYDIGAYEALP